MSDQASARVPAQLPGEAPGGIAADSPAVTFQRAREGGHVVLEMLIARHQPDQKIWSQLAAEPSGHLELVTLPIGGRIFSASNRCLADLSRHSPRGRAHPS